MWAVAPLHTVLGLWKERVWTSHGSEPVNNIPSWCLLQCLSPGPYLSLYVGLP